MLFAPGGEPLLRLIADAVPVLVAYVGADERFRFTNRAHGRWFGGSGAAHVGRHLREVLGEAAYAELRPHVVAALAGEVVSFAGEVPYAGVGPRHVQVTYVPDRGEDGGVRGFVSLVIDETEQRRAEEAQRFLAGAGAALASSLEIETTLETVAGLVVPRLADWCTVHLVAEDGTVSRVAVAHVDPAMVAWARELEQRYPYDPDSPRGIPSVLRTGTSELYPEVTDELLVAAARDEEHLAIIRRLGLTSAMVVPMVARGRAVGAISFFAAESGRRFGGEDLALAEELGRRAGLAVENARLYGRVEAAEARYRALFAQMPDAVFVADEEGRYLEVNPAAEALLGYTRDELLAMRVGELTLTPEVTQAGFGAVRSGEGSWRGEIELRRKDGSGVPLEVRATAVKLPTGMVYLAAMRDVSARKEQERFQQEFIADVAHDLKNPLAVLRGQVQLMRRRLADGRLTEEAIDAGLSTIDAGAERIAARLAELADVARLRAGQELALRPAPVDLVALVEARVAAYDRSTEAHSVRLEAPAGALIGLWDPGRLERVVDNLLSNAVKYSPRGGEVTVRLEREGEGCVVLQVADRGVGIPAADLPRVGRRFWRGANAPGIASGSGLGLAAAKQIVEQHGGTVAIASVEGEGTTVTVRLPLQSAQSSVLSPQSSALSPRRERGDR